jgi:hypothetical protein
MSITEVGPLGDDRIHAPDNVSADTLAQMVPLPEQDIVDAYLFARFGAKILDMSPIDRGELYQMDVSGATDPPQTTSASEHDWTVWGGVLVDLATADIPRQPHRPRQHNLRPHQRH